MDEMIEFVGGGKVSRAQMERLFEKASDPGRWDVLLVADVRAAMPPKRWVPSEAMIDADQSRVAVGDRCTSTRRLIEQHAAGVFAAWDAMKEADHG